MCGIAGHIGRNINYDHLSEILKSINHRGPDDRGIWQSNDCLVGLGHVRLSIRDLSSAGHQPMISNSGRFVIVYNGEIYNTRLLKERLSKYNLNYAGHSDTEILLHHIDKFGVRETINIIDGMYAFAVYDLSAKKTYIIRDKYGIKPLYYGVSKLNDVLFCSEMHHAFRQHFADKIDEKSLSIFLHHNYIPAPYTVYESIRKLEPGSLLIVDHDGKYNVNVKREFYWTPETSLNKLERFKFGPDIETASKVFGELLLESIRDRTVSDVPFGAFLSGGIDSSVVVSMLSRVAGENLNTFSVGFENSAFDESSYARALSDRFGTKHHALTLTSDKAFKIAEILPEVYSEPFADSSQIPMIAVSELASKYVKVVFSGDGADELFGGYHNYGTLYKYDRFLRKVPANICRFVSRSIEITQPLLKYSVFQKKTRRINAVSSLIELSADNISTSETREKFERTSASTYPFVSIFNSPVHNQMLTDTLFYMADDVLCKVDRASMRYSIEVRTPFLDDIRFFQFAWSLPDEIRFSEQKTKAVLKRYLENYMPAEFTNRPKKGFSIPLSDWMVGKFKPLIDHFLSKRIVERYSLLTSKQIDFMKNNIKDDYFAYKLWGVFVLHQWLESR